jgi:hypothetical protein
MLPNQADLGTRIRAIELKSGIMADSVACGASVMTARIDGLPRKKAEVAVGGALHANPMALWS